LDRAVVQHAALCYGVTSAQLRPLSGGHYSAVYEFSRGEEACVLRITPDEAGLDPTRGMIEWMRFLCDRGGPAARPVFSVHRRLVEVAEDGDQRYLITAFEKARGVLAETLPMEQWSDELFQEIGKAVGSVHALSRGYVPSDPALRRPEWNAGGNCFSAGEELAAAQATIREKYEAVLSYVLALPKGEDSYGLVHADLHLANLCVEPQSHAVTLLDFDDCAYGWYIMDIAMLLFDILVLYRGAAREPFAARFLEHYLRGYVAQSSTDAFWVQQLPHFLKLLEMVVYARLSRNYNPDDEDPWVSAFMPNRRERIEHGVPYVQLDFAAIPERVRADC